MSSFYIQFFINPLTPQNGQRHSNNSSAVVSELFESVWPFCGVCAYRANFQVLIHQSTSTYEMLLLKNDEPLRRKRITEWQVLKWFLSKLILNLNNSYIVFRYLPKWTLVFARIPAGNYMFKVHSKNSRTKFEICSKLTIKIPERRQWCRSGIFVVNFERISHLVLLFLLLTLSR